MASLRVGLDADGVLYDFTAAMRQWYVDRHGIDPTTMPEPQHWHIEDQWPHLAGDGKRFYNDCYEATMAGHLSVWGPPLPGVAELMHHLADHGHETYIVTARDFGAGAVVNEMLTERWLNLYGLPHTQVVISKDKTVVATDVFLDDKPENVDAVLSAGLLGVVRTQPWNTHRLDLPRVDTLADFAGVVDLIASIKEHSE